MCHWYPLTKSTKKFHFQQERTYRLEFDLEEDPLCYVRIEQNDTKRKVTKCLYRKKYVVSKHVET